MIGRSWIVWLVAMLAGIGQANAAGIVVFHDRDSFLTQTGALDATGPLPNLGKISEASITIGTATFSIASPSSELFIGANGVLFGTEEGLDWCYILPGNDIAISGSENLNVDLVSPVFSLGFDFVEPESEWGPYDPTAGEYPILDDAFRVSLLDSTSLVGRFEFNSPDDVLTFVGVWSEKPFSRIEIRNVEQYAAGVNDEYFGQFYTGVTPHVPEPTSLVLWSGLGVMGLISARRRRRAT